MQTYLNQLTQILENGVVRSDRTGIGTISLFGLNARYDLTLGFPVVTTKKFAWKSMVSELLWFISGSTNILDLKKIFHENNLWDMNYQDYITRNNLADDGDLGKLYGAHWRRWKSSDGSEIDQLLNAIELIKSNPSSRRNIVNAWNPAEIESDNVALPPCHNFFQFYVANGKLSLHMYQRSADMFLGAPINIASYSLLLSMIATLTDLIPGDFIHSIGDAHIYSNALDQCHEQLSRTPFNLPRLEIARRDQKSILDYKLDDFSLFDYQHHPAIHAKMAV